MVFTWAMIFCLAIAPVYGQYYSKTINLGGRVEKKTRLRFFYHDIPSGKNPTTVLLAQANITQDFFSPSPYSSLFNGSSFSLFSRYPPTDFVPSPNTICEMAIVGGRGAFRMAKGFALLRATSSSAKTEDANLEINANLYHYQTQLQNIEIHNKINKRVYS
ncbi:hypothetical protein GOBAR_AA24136 [Gossypium barbadense]|uniref:Dirigent protein n=1 Tax=Gossypium barbadense TaxID=3634 RepID=A0A2P5WZP1_GOSBA|nr:hypothetical protein GOBAR_AA24136 [Gossypium barbadense]